MCVRPHTKLGLRVPFGSRLQFNVSARLLHHVVVENTSITPAERAEASHYRDFMGGDTTVLTANPSPHVGQNNRSRQDRDG